MALDNVLALFLLPFSVLSDNVHTRRAKAHAVLIFGTVVAVGVVFLPHIDNSTAEQLHHKIYVFVGVLLVVLIASRNISKRSGTHARSYAQTSAFKRKCHHQPYGRLVAARVSADYIGSSQQKPCRRACTSIAAFSCCWRHCIWHQ